MVALCMTWSLQQVALKASAIDAAPVFQIALRSGAAAVMVLLYARFIVREHWLKRGMLMPGAAVGVLFAIEYLCVAQGLNWTSASHMVVFLYTAPLFAALGLHLRLPDERLSRLQWSGMGLAFLGIVLAFLGPALLDSHSARLPAWMWGDLLGLCAGAMWGMTTVAVRTSRLSEAPATQTLFYQLAGAFVILLAATVLLGKTHFHGSPALWTSLVFQTVFVCFVSFLVWFAMLRRYLAARLGVLSFMTPLFGVVWGVVLLNERLSAAFVAGAALVCIGLVVVNGDAWIKTWRTPWQRRRSSPQKSASSP